MIVFTNCAGSLTPATERLIIGAESAAKAKIENNKRVNINLKKNPILKMKKMVAKKWLKCDNHTSYSFSLI